jgi:hypothetical protein
MKSSVALLLVLSVAGLTIFGQAPGDEWNRYDITVELDTKAHTLSGFELVEYVNDSDQTLESLYFILWANFLLREKNPYVDEALIDEDYWNGFDPAWTKITSVATEEGKVLNWQLEAAPPVLQTYSLQEKLLRVDLLEPLVPGAKTKLKIAFITKFPNMREPGPSSYHNGIYVWQTRPWYPAAIPAKTLALGGPAEQGKNLKLETQSAWVRVRLTVPEKFKVAAGNAQQTLEKSENGRKTLLLESYTPQFSMPFVMGEPFEIYQLDYEIPIEVYYLPGHETPARFFATITADALKYYRTHFGEYGYKKLTIAEGTHYSQIAMAGDGLIVMGRDLFRTKDLVIPGMLDRGLQAGMAHEVAHMWWGAGIGFDGNAEPWLAESFSQYMSVRYFEDKYGAFGPNYFSFKKGLIEGLLDSEMGYLNLREHNDELVYLQTIRDGFDQAVVKPWADVEFSRFLDLYARLYAKGSLILRALEGLVGRATMDRILQEAAKRYMHRIITTEDFQKIAEEISGKDLQEFFSKWLYSAESLDARIDRVESQKTAEGWLTRVHLSRRGDIVMPLTVKVTTQDGQSLEQAWIAEKPQDTLTFSTKSPVQSVHLDPESMVPDADRFNNHWPRKFQFSFGKRIMPLDAYAIRLSLLGIEGGFRADHRWALSLLPDFEDKKFLLDGVGTFSLDLGRGTSLSSLLRLNDFDPIQRGGGQLTGEMGLRFTLYEHPQIGFAGKRWVPANRFRLSVGRTSQAGSAAVSYLGFDYQRDNRPGNYWLVNLASRANIPGEREFLKLSLDSYKRFRLMPNIYLDGKIALGYSFGELPGALKFALEELKSFAVSKRPITGNFKLFGQVGIVFPVVRELDYSVLNFLIVDELWGQPFVRAGQMWDKPQEIAFDVKQLKVEAGFELTVKTKMLFGLPLELTFGFAYPLQGFEEEQKGQIYFAGASLGGLLDF